MNSLSFVAAIVAALISLISPFVVRPLLLRSKAFDVPNARSSHSTPTLRGGGVAVLLGVLGGLIAASVGSGAGLDTSVIVIVTAAAVGASAIGLVEDLRGVPIAVRAGCQLVVGLVAAIASAALFDAPWWAAVVSAVLIAGYINVANFMDGVNAISSLHGFVAGVAFVVLGLVEASWWLSVAGAVIAGAFLAFLPWNLRRPGMFLGDVGSYLLGAVVATTAIAASLSGISWMAAVAPMVIYLADAGVTLARRILRHERWYQAHRTHVYQRLTDAGLSHVGVALIVAVFTAVCASIGVAATLLSPSAQPLVLVALVIVACAYLASPRFITHLRVKV